MTTFKKFSRVPNDYYATPFSATEALLKAVRFSGSIWEPACGEGHISRVLQRHGHRVISTDLIERGFGTSGIDFLKTSGTPKFRNIVTNPPYSDKLIPAFWQHALSFTRRTGGTVAMLVNDVALHHERSFPELMKNPPTDIFALDRIMCLPNGKEPQFKYAKQFYYWIVHEQNPAHAGTRFHWLPTKRV